jgi:phospholipase/carboxylesterase
MNRIQSPRKLTSSREELPIEPAFSIESGLFTPAARDAGRALFAPVHYEARYAYPLIAWLHGPGSDERQLLRIMPVVSMRNYVAVAPRGLSPAGGGLGGGALGWPQSPEEVLEAEQRIFESIEVAQHKYHIASHRVFLAGFDCGGSMALRVALANPGRFAGVLSVAGALPCGHTPLSQLTTARRLPVFLAVCRDSHQYSPGAACGDLRLFHTAGMSITLRQYPCTHQLTPLMLRDMDRWIIEQITSSAASQVESCDRSP